MATFPGAVIAFGADVIDGTDDVMAAHVNSPRAEITAIETYLRAARHEENLLADTLTHEASWLAGTTFNDLADDNYGPSLWTILNDANAPDVAGTAGGSTDPFTRYLTITLDATTRVGAVQFLTAEKTRPYRGQVVSLSADLWATGITAARMAVIVWTSTADTVTSDVVATWGSNPTLATNWAYIGTPADITISTTPGARKAVQNLTIPTNAVNLAVFIWTPSQEANTDILNIARVKLEPGAAATDFIGRDPGEELRLVNRFLYVMDASSNTAHHGFGLKSATAILRVIVAFPVPMRTAPTFSHNITAYTAGTPATTAVAAPLGLTGTFFAITGALTVGSGNINKHQALISLTAGTSWDNSVFNPTTLVIGPDVVAIFSARL